MKKNFLIETLCVWIFMMMSASIQMAEAQEKENRQEQVAETIQKALDAQAYKIDVDYMYPMKGRSRALTSLYSLEVKNDSIYSYLPYVGEAYSVPYGGGKGLNFRAPISQYESKEGKKGVTEVLLKTRNEEDSYTFRITIYKDGTSRIYVQPNNRQSISFSGKINPDDQQGPSK